MVRVGALVVVIVVAAVALLWWWRAEEPAAAGTRPATTVNVISALVRPLTEKVEVVGNARATRAVVLSAEVEGRVMQVHFQEGQAVDADDLLVELDDRQAEGERDRLRAEYQRALSDYQRASRLINSRAISQAEVDNLKNGMEAARAALRVAQATYEKHKIRAPFEGVVGLRQVDPGAYLQPGTPVVTLDSVRNLEVTFEVPERYLARVKPGLVLVVSSDSYPERLFQGKVTLLDSRVNAVSRTLAVKGSLDNSDGLLRPGQLLQIDILLSQHQALLVPEQAIVAQGAQNFVFVVAENDTALRLPVELGGRRDGWVEVVHGLSDDDAVIVNGHSRLGSGAPVTVVEDEGALLPSQRVLLETSA
ncbi:Efflux transporter, RND family, MFP subunit [Alloalcanivorax dieselolei B5]|uniref:Efflux transporter, RND family, MFP subunit n=1 Tax=Alcanivorax dieselolei (strain DSM 16502 / CGMCC 1.3690 / MCCC 1A00001 / B-5) TaxID=930169 RepID=K0CGQ4_ALCDB|nr:efflux RND transporter periplasmic adaptor subunit [Alloalcanivorax dieselolei]AFT72699.1 Efflux transporter, RND family, MFP subunit [Alloalcanivorax dieselolei B5]GGJ79920.1 MexH family multidrug efflux RND transporter periplasmic adaptor subunit [Alloalcanivorax dieselolei]